MPGLLTLNTNLKSLRYGNDRPGGGSSNQPYITKPIPSNSDPVTGNDLAKKDFLLRGGIGAPLDTATDLKRLGKYFTDFRSINGALFVAKQNVLSRIAVATQASGNQSTNDKWKSAALNEGIYTPLSTLAQAGINFIGGHVDKQGINLIGGTRTYSDVNQRVIGDPNGDGNRLVDLTNKNIGIFSGPEMFSYSGGPNSKVGIGKTNINYATDNTGATLRVLGNEPFSESFIQNQTGLKGSDTDREGIKNQFRAPLGASIKYTNNNNGKVVIGNTSAEAFIIGGVNEGTLAFINSENGITWVNNEINSISNFENGFKPLTNRSTSNNTPFPLGTSLVYNFAANRSGFGLSNQVEYGLDVNKTQGYYNTFFTSIYERGNPTPKYPQGAPTLDSLEVTQNGDQIALTQKQLSEQDITSGIQDFRKDLLDGKKSSNIMSIAPSYNPGDNKTIDGESTSRINYTSPGQKGNVYSYTKGKFVNGSSTPSITDRINALPLYKSSNVTTDPVKNDLVKFRIAAIDTENPSEKVYMHFRAFIDSFSDSYNANWNPQQYMGRGEPFYKYDNFKRDINLSFTVMAQSKPEIMIMYRKLNYLASNLAPDYTTAGYMAGPLVQLTMGGWCYELPGFISSLTLDVPQESTWEIGINGEGNFDKTVKEMPHMVKVTGFTFTPIHTFRPAKMKLPTVMTQPESNLEDNNKYGDERYIELRATNNNYDDEVNWYTK